MNRASATACRLVAATLIALGLLALAPAGEALAHGGRIKPPEPDYKPGDGNYLPGRTQDGDAPVPDLPPIPGGTGNNPGHGLTPGGGEGVPPTPRPTKPGETPRPGEKPPEHRPTT
ncbi:MAG: hypothetical protein QNJ90_02265, partial [Planctomycetota bacterium]|nr:hypothetical protein [Planctomycetota bacterium]